MTMNLNNNSVLSSSSLLSGNNWFTKATPMSDRTKRVRLVPTMNPARELVRKVAQRPERGIPFMAIRGILGHRLAQAGAETPENFARNVDADLCRALRLAGRTNELGDGDADITKNDVARFAGFVIGITLNNRKLFKAMQPRPWGYHCKGNTLYLLPELWLRYKTPGALGRVVGHLIRTADRVLRGWGLHASWESVLETLARGPKDPRKAGFVAAYHTLRQQTQAPGLSPVAEGCFTFRECRNALAEFRGLRPLEKAQLDCQLIAREGGLTPEFVHAKVDNHYQEWVDFWVSRPRHIWVCYDLGDMWPLAGIEASPATWTERIDAGQFDRADKIVVRRGWLFSHIRWGYARIEDRRFWEGRVPNPKPLLKKAVEEFKSRRDGPYARFAS